MEIEKFRVAIFLHPDGKHAVLVEGFDNSGGMFFRSITPIEGRKVEEVVDEQMRSASKRYAKFQAALSKGQKLVDTAQAGE